MISYVCSMSGTLEFVDTSNMSIMTNAEHFMATDVEWDPTGRYVATGVSWWGHKVDNAYWIWNFQGRLVHKQPMERFCQLLWRPRPQSLLSEKQLKVSTFRLITIKKKRNYIVLLGDQQVFACKSVKLFESKFCRVCHYI